MLTDMHYASVHAAQGLYVRCLHTYMGIVYHIYTPTDIQLWVYISAQRLGCSCMWFTNL